VTFEVKLETSRPTVDASSMYLWGALATCFAIEIKTSIILSYLSQSSEPRFLTNGSGSSLECPPGHSHYELSST